MRRGLLAVPLVVLALAPPAGAERRSGSPVLHEPIPADPREDVALSVALAGDIPAGIDTPRGLVSAPDPTRPIGSGESPYGPAPRSDAPDAQFRPDRDTRRPDVLPYDDPFSPSTAPFKRLSAYDTVDASYTLSVRDLHAAPLPVSPLPEPSPSEEQFFADMVVELAPSRKVRIPSVGPGARVLRARAGVGTEDVRFELFRDGAENWFIEADRATRARVVMAVAVPRAAFGGDFGNPSWAELPAVPALPPSVDRAAAEVSAKIGVSRALPPREVVSRLVSYFRGFAESEDPPTSSRDIYLDLALSKKGVCRHRAFAFLVTALHLRLPTRMIANEAHAWVEVHDGRLWRRIDLGGAGRMLHDPLSTNVPYEAPPDPFAWPEGATRGEDLGDRARRPDPTGANGGGNGPGGGGPGGAAGGADPSGAGGPGQPGGPAGPGGVGSAGAGFGPGGPSGARSVAVPAGPDDRPPSLVTMSLDAAEAHRGAPLRVRGQVSASGEACGHVTVDVVLRSRTIGDVVVGQLATDERGAYDGALVLPAEVPLGEYEIWAHTLGDARCGQGRTR